MKLILIRHGETKEGKKGIILGQLPGTLSIKGKATAKQLARLIKSANINPSVIFSSDLRRAKETSEIIAKILKLPIKYDQLLRERFSGQAEGKLEKEINWKEYEKKKKPFRRHPEGESFSEVRTRAKNFIKKINKIKNKDIIVVSHSAFLSMLFSVFYKWSVEKSLKWDFSDRITILDLQKKSGAEFIPLPKTRAIQRKK